MQLGDTGRQIRYVPRFHRELDERQVSSDLTSRIDRKPQPGANTKDNPVGLKAPYSMGMAR